MPPLQASMGLNNFVRDSEIDTGEVVNQVSAVLDILVTFAATDTAVSYLILY